MHTRMNDMVCKISSQATRTNQMRNDFNDRMNTMVNVSSQSQVASVNFVSVASGAANGPNTFGSSMPATVVMTDNRVGIAATATAKENLM